MVTKLHEILAVEDSLNKVFGNAAKEAQATFGSRDHLFKGHRIVTTPLEEDVEGHLAVSPDSEVHDVSETVHGKLTFLFDHLTRAFNVYGQKERTNQSAKANLVVAGEVLIEDCPATMLLGLETRLRNLREVCEAIKTTDQSKGWTPTQQEHIVEARPETKFITKKVQRERVVIEPTEHQPGQYATYNEDVRVGEKTTVHASGLISPREKSDLLARIDVLMRAAKKARQRANGAEVDTKFKAGKVIKNFILNGNGAVEEDE